MPSLKRAVFDFFKSSNSLPSAAVAAMLASACPVQAQMKYPNCEDLASSQFRKVTVASGGLQEPVKMAFLPDNRLIFVERRGAVKIVKPGSTTPISAWSKKVFWEKSLRNTKIEDGTLGIAVDPRFATNNWLYILYSPLTKATNRLSRFTLKGDQIDTLTEKVILEIDVQRDYCCHTGGGMGFDAYGNLYLTTGDNTGSDDQFAAINETANNTHRDAQRSSGNTNDLRGKLIRIKPKPLAESTSPGPTPGPGSTYDIPAGNMKEAFASVWPNQADKDKVRPEIYSMGHRNPYTLFVDKYTGWAHIAEVGPDAGTATADKGPAKHEEYNLVKKAGNFGWPYFIGNNMAYKDWNYATGTTGPAFNPASPVNNSVNNTGVQALPPASMAILSRENAKKGKTVDGVEQFTAFEGTSAIGGTIYYYDGRNTNPNKLPPHFDRKFLMSDHGPSILNAVTLNANADAVTDVSRVPLPNISGLPSPFDRPVGLDVGPDGMLYVIEYAAGNFDFTTSTKISRIEYTGTCHPATPIPPDPPTAVQALERNAGKLLALVDGGRAVDLPASALGFALYDVRGAKVWEYSRARTGTEERVALPSGLPQGILKIRMLSR